MTTGQLVVMIIFLIIVILGSWQARRRRQKWLRWVQARDWRFVNRPRIAVKSFRGGPFGKGSARLASWGFDGVFDGLPAGGFRYRYTVGSGRSSRTYHFHVLRISFQGAQFPLLSLEHENLLTRVFVNDIQFEDAEFNQMWKVHGDDPRFVHGVIHPRMMEFLKREAMPQF